MDEDIYENTVISVDGAERTLRDNVDGSDKRWVAGSKTAVPTSLNGSGASRKIERSGPEGYRDTNVLRSMEVDS